jgi:hypothetical protein
MAINDAFKTDLAFKKLGYGTQATSTSKQGYEDLIASPVPTYDKDIWAETSAIPIPAAELDNISVLSNDTLTLQSGSTTVFLSPYKDYIPLTFHSSYTVQVKDSSTPSKTLPPGSTNYFFDYTSGTLVFPEGAGSYSGYTLPLKVSAYRYIGKKGMVSNDLSGVVGDITALITTDRTSVVRAINEVKRDILGTILEEKTYTVTSVLPNETRKMWLTLESNCYIKGIQSESSSFRLKLLTKPKSDGGQWVYDSGDITDILWDVMEIPFISEYGGNLIWLELTNKGLLTTDFNIIIYVDKIR